MVMMMMIFLILLALPFALCASHLPARPALFPVIDVLGQSTPTLQRQTFRVGPFRPQPQKENSFRIEAPHPSDAVAIRFWGGWNLVREDSTAFAVGEVFLHHIMLYGSDLNGHNVLITGSSDERSTFGPNLWEPYALIVHPQLHVTGSALLVSFLDDVTDVYVEYTLEYYTHASAPLNLLSALPIGHAISLSVPEDYAEDVYVVNSDFVLPENGQLLTGVGHLHVGAIATRIFYEGEEICASLATHHDEMPCFIECPKKCRDGSATWPALSHISFCKIDRWFPSGSKFQMQITYNGMCNFNAAHGQIYMWYSPSKMELPRTI